MLHGWNYIVAKLREYRMHVDNYYESWVRVFISAGIDEAIALEKFEVWVEGLGGEIENEYSHSETSVTSMAESMVSSSGDEWC